jgi:hypothetical protein
MGWDPLPFHCSILLSRYLTSASGWPKPLGAVVLDLGSAALESSLGLFWLAAYAMFPILASITLMPDAILSYPIGWGNIGSGWGNIGSYKVTLVTKCT